VLGLVGPLHQAVYPGVGTAGMLLPDPLVATPGVAAAALLDDQDFVETEVKAEGGVDPFVGVDVVKSHGHGNSCAVFTARSSAVVLAEMTITRDPNDHHQVVVAGHVPLRKLKALGDEKVATVKAALLAHGLDADGYIDNHDNWVSHVDAEYKWGYRFKEELEPSHKMQRIELGDGLKMLVWPFKGSQGADAAVDL
jgi:hypothetical protein